MLSIKKDRYYITASGHLAYSLYNTGEDGYPIAGFINMPNIRTTPDKSDSASQHFFYLMPDILFGAVFKIAHK